MADVTQIKWLYPPNWIGTFPPGTQRGLRRYVVQCLCDSDGTGEDEAVKVKRTDLLTSDGNVPSKLVVEKVEYDINGMSIDIEWNNHTDERICRINSGNGTVDFRDVGGISSYADETEEAGDIVFNTSDASSGDNYDVRITVRAED